jgi:Ca2+-binding EF-hand superfamily protein
MPLLSAFLALSAFACTNTTQAVAAVPSGSSEEGGFSQSDLLGLAVSVGFLLVVVAVCCYSLKLEQKNEKEPEDVEEPWKRDTTQVGKPNLEQVDDVHLEIFQLLDEDNSGTVSYQELENILDEETANFIFERFDQDNSGTLSIWEIKQLYPTLNLAQHALVKLRAGKEAKKDWNETCLSIWNKLDHDNSGTVDMEELEQLWGTEISSFILSRFDSEDKGALTFAQLKRVFPTFKDAYEALDKLAEHSVSAMLDKGVSVPREVNRANTQHSC